MISNTSILENLALLYIHYLQELLFRLYLCSNALFLCVFVRGGDHEMLKTENIYTKKESTRKQTQPKSARFLM